MTNINSHLEELVLIMNNHQDQEKRDKAGEKIIDFYVQTGRYNNLIVMSKYKDISETLRNKAGEKLIDFYIQTGRYNNLITMSKDKDISETLRNKAEEKAKERILNLSKKYEL